MKRVYKQYLYTFKCNSVLDYDKETGEVTKTCNYFIEEIKDTKHFDQSYFCPKCNKTNTTSKLEEYKEEQFKICENCNGTGIKQDLFSFDSLTSFLEEQNEEKCLTCKGLGKIRKC